VTSEVGPDCCEEGVAVQSRLAGITRVEASASDSTNTLREILEFVRLEIEDGHGLTLTHGEASVLMAEFDRRRDPQDRVPPHCQTCECWRGS